LAIAHNRGRQGTGLGVSADGAVGGVVDTKATFNNLPFMYGVVERTFSEHMASAWPMTNVSDYSGLPEELRAGAAKAAYESALVAGTDGNFEDGSFRYFTCQTCHMRPVEGKGCNKKGALNRKDLALHDMTGGNYWMPEAIKYQDTQGQLRLGGGLTATQVSALDDGAVRAMKQLAQAASLIVDEAANNVTIVNHSGHKLISGYPEGRRMWLQVRWYDGGGIEIPGERSGDYGDFPTAMDLDGDGNSDTVRTILNPETTTVYEAHYGMTQGWAEQLVGDPFFVDPDLVLSYDHFDGSPDTTLGDLADGLAGPEHETFHFVLNNTVIKDNRIPPFGFSKIDAATRNALPVPDTQYGGDLSETYNHFDVFNLAPPATAAHAEIDLLYQPTSWE
jgi:hypothetical protein